MSSTVVIGCGGIGSYFAEILREMIDKSQLPFIDSYTLVDFDIVEPKNMLYQNFMDEDLAKNKAEALGKRHGFKFLNLKIESEDQLAKFDKLIICADNTTIRKLCYAHCSKTGKFFLDLRSQGRVNTYLVHKKQKLKEMLKTLPEGTESRSCQIEQKLEKGQIDISNRIIALKGIQLLLNLHRNIETDDYSTENI